MSRSEIARIRAESTIKTRADIRAEKEARELVVRDKKAKAKLRKEKMQKLEAERKRTAKPSAEAILRSKNRNALLEAASRQMAEQEDDVKAMNRMILYANCVTIRDQQLVQKKTQALMEEKYDRAKDLEMEINRLQGLRRVEGERAERKAKGREMANMIRQQIEMRERARLLEAEALEQEKLQMKAQQKQLELEEEQARAAKRKKGKVMLKEVLAANQEAIARKALRKVEEAEEDAAIAAYVAEKLRREEEYEEEQQRIADEKEKEVARLRAEQERARDTQAEKDELQARRYQEALERAQREREEKEAQSKKDAMRTLIQARKDQERFKVDRLRQLALDEYAVYERNKVAVRENQEQFEKRQAEIKQSRRNHCRALKDQIAENERRRKQERADMHEQADIDRAEREAYIMKIDKIKQQKIAYMKQHSIPEKYMADLVGYKVAIPHS